MTLEPIAELQARFGQQGAISFAERLGGLVALLDWGGAQSVVALQGAQVLSYEAAGYGEVLWLSPEARLGTGKAVRGGIPICWPWFGPHPQGGDGPAHGFVRTRPWRVVSAHADENGTRLTLAPDGPPAHPAWPHTAELSLEIVLGTSLTLSLSTRNTGASPFALTQALHSYFLVQDISAAEVDGLQHVVFIDQLDPGALKSESGLVRIAGEVDRIYQDVIRPITIIDGSDRRIVIQSHGSASAVVWNPWIEKAARLGDMGEGGYRRLVCVETANAGADVITLAPGARHTLTAIIAALGR